jgi:hypothetical protein
VLTGEDACRDRHPLETSRRGVFAIGEQFVHYAMTDLPPKLEFHESAADGRLPNSL